MTTYKYKMPIHLESHDSDVDLDPGTTKSDIVAFLYRNPALGFRPAEISDELEIPKGTATTTLKRLYEGDHIGKTEDSFYHALEHREDLRRYVAGLTQLHRLFDHESTPGDTDFETSTAIDEANLEAEIESLESELE
jgi:DNA-binding MarR family transcriptional regulator